MRTTAFVLLYAMAFMQLPICSYAGKLHILFSKDSRENLIGRTLEKCLLEFFHPLSRLNCCFVRVRKDLVTVSSAARISYYLMKESISYFYTDFIINFPSWGMFSILVSRGEDLNFFLRGKNWRRLVKTRYWKHSFSYLRSVPDLEQWLTGESRRYSSLFPTRWGHRWSLYLLKLGAWSKRNLLL